MPGEKRTGAVSGAAPGPPDGGRGTNGPATTPSPPSQPRKSTGSRPVLSARSNTTGAAQPVSGPLVASVLGSSFGYQHRNASPGPQRPVASPQHSSVQRSASASLQRASSTRHRSTSQAQAAPGKPLFAAYGLQYSSNGRHSVGPTLGATSSRTSASMSPYRSRPASSTGPPSSGAAAAAMAGRPSTSQAAQRPAGESWFGNTKLSVTLPANTEAARVVQELGHLLSVFAPPAPSSGAAGSKGPASFRASKYSSGSAGGSSGGHREAWGTSGGGADPAAAAGSVSASMPTGAMLRPNSAASSTGSASKPMMASYMGDGRHSQGHSANLSLMRLQQQQQQQAVYAAPGVGGSILAGAPGASLNPQQLQLQGQPSATAVGPAYPGTAPGAGPGPYLHTTYITFQPPGSGGGAPPPRLNFPSGGGASPMLSPKEHGGGVTSPHGIPVNAPHQQTQLPAGPPPGRPWEAGYGSAAAAGSASYAQPGMNAPHPPPGATTSLSPRPPIAVAGGATSQSHYLPVKESGQSTTAANTHQPYPGVAPSSAAGYPPTSYNLAMPPPHSLAATAPASLSFNAAMSAAAAAALGNYAPQPALPVPNATGPATHVPHSTLGPAAYTPPLHQAAHQHAVIGSDPAPIANVTGGPGSGAAAYSSAARAAREALMGAPTTHSYGSASSANNSASQAQFLAASGTYGGGTTTVSATPSATPPAPTAVVARASASLAHAPQPMGLPPPSPVKAAPPATAPSTLRSPLFRSNSLRSSGSASDNNALFNNSILAAAGGAEREEHPSSGASGHLPTQPATPTRPVYSTNASVDGGAGSAAGAAPPSTGYASPHAVSGSGASQSGHVTWSTGVPQGSAPATPTRPSHNGYGDSAAGRRISTGSQLGSADVGSPFARGPDGFSRMLTEHGTLTCVRPSTVPSNFAADSQPDLSTYVDNTVSPSPGSMNEPQGGVAGGSEGSASTAAPPASTTRTWEAGTTLTTGASPSPRPWRQPTEEGDQPSGSGAAAQQQPVAIAPGAYSYPTSSLTQALHQHQRQQQEQRQQEREQQQQQQAASSAATPSAPVAQQVSHVGAREEAGWGRSRDQTPTRSHAQPSTSQQQQQGSSDAAASAFSATAAAAAAASALRQAVAAATEAAAGSALRASAGTSSASAHQAAAASAPAPAPASSGTAVSHATTAPLAAGAAATVSGVPLPSDQPLRPRTTSSGSSQPVRSTPWPTAPTPATTATTATAPASTATGAATPASTAASSAAGSAVSAASTSSGSGTTASSSSTGGSAGSSSSAAPASGATATQHPSSARRSSSLAPRFNPAAVLGSEPDPTFGNLLPGYSVGKVIGEGGFCQVRLAVHHLSQRRVAVKVIDRAKLVDPNEAKRMQREIRVMKHLSHQCVIKLFEVVESPRHLFLVMEHAPSGSLLDYVRARKRLPEADACVFFQQIVASLEYCHSREVVHRDIKLENILLDAEQRMKLIDFGLSAFFVPGKRLRVHCGSPSYAAPEIVARKAYEGPPVDVWSLGVVLFAMVAGYLPFHASGGNKQELCNKIMAGQYTAPDWLSAPMKDLLARMLTTDPEKRITFQQVWQHSWVRNGPQWHERGVNCYEVAPDASAPGGLRCDEQVVAELEAAGYPRSMLAQHLAAGEANHLTASYFLLCEAKAEALRRLRASGSSAGRSRPSTGSSSARGSSATYPAAGVAASSGGSSAAAAAAASPAKARGAAGESPRGSGGSSSSRPSTAVGSGYSSARGRSGQAGEEVPVRTAVAV